MNRKEKLAALVESFDIYYRSGVFEVSSEATARSWIEEFLKIFDWDSSNPHEVEQENSIDIDARAKMSEIEASHRIPDYALRFNNEILYYVDAKKIAIEIETCKKSAFQIRSYGWSSGTPISIVTNFKEIAIYDSRFIPEHNHDASIGRLYFIKYTDYLKHFDILEKHLLKENVQSKKIHDMYSGHQEIRGSKTLDQDFAEFLSTWRLLISNNIFQNNENLTIDYIQEQTQLTLDRIIFLRIAEGRQIESFGSLKKMTEKKDCYYHFFKKCHDIYSKKYGGHLFKDVKNLKINSILLSEFLESLYFPFPYRFEVIPIEILGNMYEKYLGKKLNLEKNEVKDDFKPEYQKQKGAVYTPNYIVNLICNETIGAVLKNSPIGSIEEILNLKMIDPSCGSGSFLLGILDYLEVCVTNMIQNNLDTAKKHQKWYWIDSKRDKIFLTTQAKQKLIKQCIYGLDIDSQAVSVAKLSLSLKALGEGRVISRCKEKIALLDNIGENIKHGNALVDDSFLKSLNEDDFDIEKLDLLKIFNWEDEFDEVFKTRGGFDIIVGNPPYIETKQFKKENPYLHQILSLKKNRLYQTAAGGKLDIAMPFIERGLKKLNKHGVLGYIVTNRFFKSDYGKATREYLSRNKYIASIFDFGELKIFQNRSTYTAIFQMTQMPNEYLKYYKVDTLTNIEKNIFTIFKDKNTWPSFSYDTIGGNPWNFSYPDLLKLTESLSKKFKKIEDTEEISLKVGLQVLYDKIYHLKKISATLDTVVGLNGLGEKIEIEKGFLRPLICNENFYAFKNLEEKFFCIFPYDIVNGKDHEITLYKVKERYPKAYSYLMNHKSFIQAQVGTIKDENRWHLYTRKQNLVSQVLMKLLFPTTIIDTVATVDCCGKFYQDNARIFSLIIKDASEDLYWAIAAIFNSSVFNCLSKVTTNPLQEGHVQFNKQFVNPIPFPFEVIRDNFKLQKTLSDMAHKIVILTQSLAQKNSFSKIQTIKQELNRRWENLDAFVESEIYCLSNSERAIVKKYPRKKNRVEYYLALNSKESDFSE